MKRVMASVLVPGMTVLSLGCSLARSSSQSIVITPSHPNAEVFVDGVSKGTGTQHVDMSRKESHSIMAKCGGSSGVAMVSRELSTTGLLDIVGGILILIPFIGLFSPGAFELSPSVVSVAIPDDSKCVVEEG